MVSVVCGDFDKDESKCAGVEVPETKESPDDKSLGEIMKKIMDKIL